MFDSIGSLEKDGFVGFKTVAELRANRSCIPKERGVYIVFYNGDEHPAFLSKGFGGEFKGEDKNVAISKLEEKWLSGPIVIYIGQAGGKINGKLSDSTLFGRIDAYIRYGMGENIGHQGGCYIWQIDGCESLLVCWKRLPSEVVDPEEAECELLFSFKARYGRLPFANRKGCRKKGKGKLSVTIT
jgi:hypothetical protein